MFLLPACGDATSGPSPEERAKATREKTLVRRQKEVQAKLSETLGLVRDGKLTEAWVAWREARDLAGETPDVARVAAEIREGEKRAREKDERAEVFAALNRDTSAATAEARLTALASAAEAARAFLETYPDTEQKEEIREGLAYAESELALHRGYASSLEDARKHFAARRYEECARACDKALSFLEGKDAKELRARAWEALTPEGMTFIPGGSFLAGKGREPTYLAPLYIDRTEVTNAQYAAFLTATGHKEPQHFTGGEPPAGKEDHPVVHVTLDDALAYASWAKKRLATEVEWERAARGTDGRAYPWGEEWDPKKGNFSAEGTLPVGSKPFDRSPDGVLDMGGNVMELTLSKDDPEGKHAGPVLKGGHWSDDFHPPYAMTFSRYPVDRKHSGSGSGFRCVKPVGN